MTNNIAPMENPPMENPPMENPPMENPMTKDLVGWGSFEKLKDAILSRLFGTLVELSHDVLEFYQSDLYWDALWLRDNITGPTTFGFSVRKTGTAIGPYAEVVRRMRAEGLVDYIIQLHQDDRQRWLVTVTRL